MSIIQFSKAGGHIGALAGAMVGFAFSLSLVPYDCATLVPFGNGRVEFLDEHSDKRSYHHINLGRKISLLTDQTSHYVFKPSDERFEMFWKCTAQGAPFTTVTWSLRIAAFGAALGAILGCGRGLYNRV